MQESPLYYHTISYSPNTPTEPCGVVAKNNFSSVKSKDGFGDRQAVREFCGGFSEADIR